MLQQFVGFFLRRRAVIPRDRDFHPRRNQGTFQALDLFHDVIGHGHRVLALALGNGERNGRRLSQGLAEFDVAPPLGRHCQAQARRYLGAGAVAEEHVIGRLLGTIANLGHIAQIDRAAGGNPHHHAPHVVGVAQEVAGLNVVLLIRRRELSHLQALVGPVDGAHHRGGRNSVTRHLGGIQQHANLPALAADHLRLRRHRQCS